MKYARYASSTIGIKRHRSYFPFAVNHAGAHFARATAKSLSAQENGAATARARTARITFNYAVIDVQRPARASSATPKAV